MSDTSERSSSNEGRLGIGQHRSSPGQVADSGQRTRLDPGVNVGPNLSGGELQNSVPGSKADSMTHAHGEANTDPHGLRHRKA
jgi:hypothetical protein